MTQFEKKIKSLHFSFYLDACVHLSWSTPGETPMSRKRTYQAFAQGLTTHPEIFMRLL